MVLKSLKAVQKLLGVVWAYLVWFCAVVGGCALLLGFFFGAGFGLGYEDDLLALGGGEGLAVGDVGFAFVVFGGGIEEGDAEVEGALDDADRAAQTRIDQAVSKGVIHKNTAARQKSRLAKRLALLAKGSE